MPTGPHRGRFAFAFYQGRTRAAALRGVAESVIVGGQHARLARLDVGDRVTLRGPGGARRAPVTGVLDGIADMGGNEMQLSLTTMDYGSRATRSLRSARAPTRPRDRSSAASRR